MKPFSEACERNKEPILSVVRDYFSSSRRVLEIGSGTGQHAVFFASAMPELEWQPSDVAEHLAGIGDWLEEASLPNLRAPVELDVCGEWPQEKYDGVFSANTAHIMAWHVVEKMVLGIGQVLEEGGTFCLYGPFNYNGEYTSESNRNFDDWLHSRDPQSGIRDFEAVDALAADRGFRLLADREMPANNRLLVWRKSVSEL